MSSTGIVQSMGHLASSGFHSSTAPSINTSYPTPNNQPAILGPGGLVGGPPPPPPVLIDQDFERAQRMLDVCPGLAQKIAKLRSTRNSSMLSTEISTQKASMDLHWQSGEFKTMAESQLEKSGGGVSLGMGF
ncbi:hypothetical protein PSTT_16812 [Puccinia striiformis]|uniref:Uncharacterized protein n=1 Tax=Puccinia striiformis TaxID=27350 RepID=A0A2S4UB76_9BASI|nr:hypothetical protein PSTT_16812 [Puccinia striiformis]